MEKYHRTVRAAIVKAGLDEVESRRAVEQWNSGREQSHSRPEHSPHDHFPLTHHASRLTPHDRRGPPPMPRAELGIHGLRSWGRNLSRKVRETRSSSSRKRSEPAAHPCRGPGGQAGDEHGESPWFKGGVEPGRMARVVEAVGRRASSQSFPPRSGLVQAEIDRSSRHDARGRRGRAGQQTSALTSLYKTDSSPVLNGRPVQVEVLLFSHDDACGRRGCPEPHAAGRELKL